LSSDSETGRSPDRSTILETTTRVICDLPTTSTAARLSSTTSRDRPAAECSALPGSGSRLHFGIVSGNRWCRERKDQQRPRYSSVCLYVKAKRNPRRRRGSASG